MYFFATSNYAGNNTALDIWTYTVGSDKYLVNTDMVIINLDGYDLLNLSGFVFFDKDKNGSYDQSAGDFALSDVTVELDYYYIESRWTTRSYFDQTILTSAFLSHTETNDSGETTPVIDYYFHNYALFPCDNSSGETGSGTGETTTASYYLYADDHSGTDSQYTQIFDDENPVTVTVTTTVETIEGTGGVSSTETVYRTWLPAHDETVTDAVGNYYFRGILVNQLSWSEDNDSAYNQMVVSVKNPDSDLYTLTTADAQSGTADFSLTGDDASSGSQILLISEIKPLLNAIRDEQIKAEPENKNVIANYEMADVGYWYSIYEPPLTLIKLWGNAEDANNVVAGVTLHLEGFGVKDGMVYYETDVVISYASGMWSYTVPSLPGETKSTQVLDDNGDPVYDKNESPIMTESQKLSYRVSSEKFIQIDNADDKRYLYCYSVDWIFTADPEDGYTLTQSNATYTRSSIDESGEVTAEPEILDPVVYPYTTMIGQLEETNTGDSITVQNWPTDTIPVTIYKLGASDEPLYGATFQLQKLNDDTGNYEDVSTISGKYLVTTDENGMAVFYGLSKGTYRLYETVAPTYYTLPANHVTFTLEKDSDGKYTLGTIVGSGTEDGTIGNNSVVMNKDGTIVATIYNSLDEAPASQIIKYDQYGNKITEKVSFTLYAANENYIYDSNTASCYQVTLNSDSDEDNGEYTFTVTLADGTAREMYTSELVQLLGSPYFVLVETDVPDGYRTCGTDAHLRVVGSGMESYILCDNPFESGVWTTGTARVYAPETLYVADSTTVDDNNAVLSSNSYHAEDGSIDYTVYTSGGTASGTGMLFAVVLKRDNADSGVTDLTQFTFEGWHPVYGNDIEGYTTMTEGDTLDNVCTIASGGNAFYFTASSDKTVMTTEVSSLPGYINRYYTYMMDSAEEEEITNLDPQFLVAYYYSTATSKDEITANNTVRVTSHGLTTGAEEFSVFWSTTISVPDIVNALYPQKADTAENLIDGAVFALYPAVADDTTGHSYFVGTNTGSSADDAGSSADNAGNSADDAGGSADNADSSEVYITLSESGDMSAVVYDSSFSKISEGTYSINTDGCADVLDDTGNTVQDGYVHNEGAGVITVTAGGATYTITPAKNAHDETQVAYTHDVCSSVAQEGTGHMRYLRSGKYLLKEIYAPAPFILNHTNTEVLVDGTGVYANAGTDDNDVRVGNGAGYLVSTLNSFASPGDISETLTYIIGAMRRTDDISDGFFTGEASGWKYITADSTNPTNYVFDSNATLTETLTGTPESDTETSAPTASLLHLVYNGEAASSPTKSTTLFDYAVNTDVSNLSNYINSLCFWTDYGWSTLAVYQDRSVSRPGALTQYEDLGTKDITSVFSGSTFVQYTDETRLDLQVVKLADTTNSSEVPLSDAKFVIYYIDDNDTNCYYRTDGTWKVLGENETEESVAIVSGSDGSISLLKALTVGTVYLKELQAPDGYNLMTDVMALSVGSNKVTASLGAKPVNDYVVYEGIVDGAHRYTLRIYNSTGYELPATGGAGTTLFTLCGLLLITASLVYGCRGKRRYRSTMKKSVGGDSYSASPPKQ